VSDGTRGSPDAALEGGPPPQEKGTRTAQARGRRAARTSFDARMTHMPSGGSVTLLAMFYAHATFAWEEHQTLLRRLKVLELLARR
jgi:hypothetical protein